MGARKKLLIQGLSNTCTYFQVFFFFFFLYNGSLSLDSLFGGEGRGKENGLYIFFNSIQCWTVPARYMEVSRWPTPYFSTTSMVQYGTDVLVSLCQHWAYFQIYTFFSFALIVLVSFYKFNLVLPVSHQLFCKTVASKTACSSKRFTDHKKNFSAGVVPEGRNSSLKITKVACSLDLQALLPPCAVSTFLSKMGNSHCSG